MQRSLPIGLIQNYIDKITLYIAAELVVERWAGFTIPKFR